MLGETDPETPSALHDLGGLLLEMGRLRDAEPLLRRALRLRRGAGDGKDEGAVVATTGALARLQREEGRGEEAESLCREALAGATSLYGPRHAETVAYEGLLRALQEDAAAAAAEASRLQAEGQWARRIAARRAGVGAEGGSPGRPE